MTELKSSNAVKIRDVMSPHVVYCYVEDTVPEVAKKMMDNWVDTLFCIEKDSGKVKGVITDGIIWKLVAKADPKIYQYKAKDLMVTKLISIDGNKPFNSIEELRDEFEKSPIKRIAVTSNGRIIGLIRRKFIERIKRYSRTFDIKFS
ncbi:MAG: CBS domain-containing protein [Candidatus Helarchaeota archaeon]